jgi:hypothetical protein
MITFFRHVTAAVSSNFVYAMVPKEYPASWGSVLYRVLTVHMVTQAHKVHQVSRVKEECTVISDILEKKDTGYVYFDLTCETYYITT